MTVDARRIALMTRMVEKAPSALGRTALMKFMYFLTTIRGVPLGYDFSLYSYGPFDSSVLEDIDYAARLGALNVTLQGNAVGYGYLIRPGTNANSVKDFAPDFIAAHEGDLDWVLGEFGNLNATELELISTIIYVDQEGQGSDVIERVHQIKPHFTTDRIGAKRAELLAKGLVS